MQDRFENRSGAIDGPATHGFAITPHNTTELAETTRGLYVGTGGAVAVVLSSAAEIVFANVADGSLLPVRAIKVKATGTTASQIIGLV